MPQRALVRRLLLGVCLLLSAAHPGLAQAAFPLGDLRTGSATPPFPALGESAALGDLVLFTADDGVHGQELWRSDGTEAGTSLVKDICRGSCSPWARLLTAAGNRVYFSSFDFGVWASDGTEAGTVRIFEEFAYELAELGDALFFVTPGADGWGYDLWKSDGTPAGTILVKHLAGSYQPSFLGTAGGHLFFAADSDSLGRELWKTDGTAAGTVLVKDIEPGSGNAFSYNPERFPEVGGRLFFRAFISKNGYELWVTDGTEAGTYLVKDLAPGTTSSYPRNLRAYGQEVVFITNTEVWKSDGTEDGTVLLHPGDLSPSGTLQEIAVAGDLVFFQAGDADSGSEVWKSDGTTGGSARVADIAPGPLHSLSFSDELFTPVGDRLAFFADDGTHGLEPWATDGTEAGTLRLGDLNPGAAGSLTRGSEIVAMPGIVLGDRWLFAAYTDPAGWALWATDGTVAGTQRVRLFPASWSSVSSSLFADFAGSLFFEADGNAGRGLWKSDGTEAGTIQVKPLSSQSFGREMLPWNGHLYYLANNTSLWKSDGTEAGTQQFEAAPGTLGYISALTPTPSGLFFTTRPSGYAIWELWVTDGTTEGSRKLLGGSNRIEDPVAFRQGIAVSVQGDLWLSDGTAGGTGSLGLAAYVDIYQKLAPVGDRLFFFAAGSGTGFEPWISDGTLSGTRLIKDIRPGFARSSPLRYQPPAAALRNRWLFLADDGTSGEELWVSDGTAAGTRRVRDIRPGPQGSAIETMIVGRDRVWFTADDGAHGRELWTTDGTEAGTRLVRDIVTGTETSWPRELRAVGHILLFSAWDPVSGVELWRSDGTEAGTVRLQDIAPGVLPSSPSRITPSGPYAFFAANDGTTGFEPWALDRTLLGGFLTATKTVSGRPFPGRTLTYTITISNVGAGPHPDRPGDEMVDQLPAGLTLASASADTGLVTTVPQNNRVLWNGALPIGGSATVTIEATVSATHGSVLRNRAALAFDADGDGAIESAGTSGAADVLIFSGPLAFHTITPCRVADTRSGTPLENGALWRFHVAGACGIPLNAEAVVANLTVVASTAPGYVTVWTSEAPEPGTSNINFAAGALRSNIATLPLGTDRAVDARAVLFGNAGVHLILDVSGYYLVED